MRVSIISTNSPNVHVLYLAMQFAHIKTHGMKLILKELDILESATWQDFFGYDIFSFSLVLISINELKKTNAVCF